ncbi:MAG: ester cyclase [Kiritimatiellae bacterium]|nr:ester cyclase [Kiritimatiellia bacterium]
MKSAIVAAATVAAACICSAETTRLPAPDGDSGVTVAQALKARHSERAFADKELSPELLSGVLWAANGFNRPDKRTNATGLNKQEISVYAIMKSGAYRYDAKGNALVKVCDEDLRPSVAGHQPFAATAPVSLLIAADVSDPIYTGARSTLSNYDAGIVSGNIYLYCAANGLATVCRRSMDNDALKKALKLPDTTILHLNHPVGYPAGGEDAAVGAPSVKTERNREAMRLFEKCINANDLELGRRLISEKAAFNTPVSPTPLYGAEGYLSVVALMRRSFPDVQWKLVDMVADEKTVAVQWECSGTFNGDAPFAGLQPNGRRFSTTVMNFYSFDDDGKIFKDVAATGIAGILQGIGAIK